MGKALIAAAAVVLFAASAFAGDDVMSNYFGNTVISRGGMGESHMHYKPDHTFDVSLIIMGMTRGTTGTWKIDEKGQLCRTYVQAPPGMPNPLCTPWTSHKVGDAWTIQYNGAARSVSLVQGLQ